jgi:hypothetical protein
MEIASHDDVLLEMQDRQQSAKVTVLIVPLGKKLGIFQVIPEGLKDLPVRG